jgi:hypothetical protein
MPRRIWLFLFCAVLLAARVARAEEAPSKKDAPSQSSPEKQGNAEQSSADDSAEYTTERIRGKVVWTEDALKRLYGISTEPAAAERSVIFEMQDGRLWPIVPDTRGHAFAVDERLRDVELELLVRRYHKVPMIQVIRVMRPTDEGLLEVDYWCDICAIPMYILKPCECCQGETRLRERPVEEVFQP